MKCWFLGCFKADGKHQCCYLLDHSFIISFEHLACTKEREVKAFKQFIV